MAKNIVLIEDEEKIGKITCAYLNKEGYEIRWFQDGLVGWNFLKKEEPDLLILDLMLPNLLGIEICRKLRSKGSKIPILMLTARGEESDRIKGLEIGADDYMVKPFSLRELVARIHAILRRYNVDKTVLAEKLSFRSGDKDLEIDLTQKLVKVNKRVIELTVTEFNILALLAQNPNRPFNREELILKLQGYDYDGFDRVIDAHIKNLRKKLDFKSNQFIITIYGIGYKFSEGKEKNG